MGTETETTTRRTKLAKRRNEPTKLIIRGGGRNWGCGLVRGEWSVGARVVGSRRKEGCTREDLGRKDKF